MKGPRVENFCRPAAARGAWARLDALAVSVFAGAVVVVVTQAPSPARAPLVLAMMLTCPGYGLMRALRLRRDWLAASVVVGTSVAAQCLIAQTEVQAAWWHPQASEFLIAAITAGLVAAARLRSDDLLLVAAPVHDEPSGATSARWPPLAAVCALAGVATLLWVVGVLGTSVDRLGLWGLLPRLPGTWYAGLALVVAGIVLAQALGGRQRSVATAVFVALLVVYLFATAPAVEPTPRYTWIYKHLGVVRYILMHHDVAQQQDIYQRWPAVFSVSAWYSKLTGLAPISYAAWAEPLFTLLDVMMVYPFLRRFAGRQASLIGCIFFVVTNWIGQQYLSPQALAYLMTMTLLMLTVPLFDGAPLRLWKRLVPYVRPIRARQRVGVLPNRYVVSLVLLIDGAIITAHQLTPYLVLFALAALTVTGMLRPWPLVIGVAVLTGYYLLPNLGYIQHNFGLFTTFDPFRNATSEIGAATHYAQVKVWEGWAARALTLLAWMVGVAGIAIRARLRRQRRAVVLASILFTAPFLLFLGQSYGGEARLRVLLFSLPACSVGAAWVWEASGATIARRLVAWFLLLIAPTALFLPNFFGQEDLYYVPPGEVAAADWLYTNAPPGQVLMMAVPGFPIRYGADYYAFPGPSGDANPNLELVPRFARADLRRGDVDVDAVIAAMRDYSPAGYLLFSTTQRRYARAQGYLGGESGYRRLEATVAGDPRFHVVFSDHDAQIYRLE